LLNRFEKHFLTIVSFVIIAFAIINTILHARGYYITLYVMTRDVAVLSVAGALLIGNFAAMRGNNREGSFFLAILCLLVIVATVHLYRLIYGGLPCR
jgi:uncharacterized membrane protein